MENPLLGSSTRTVICCVVFIDIVEYSKKTVAKQLALKGWFNDLLTLGLQNTSPADHLIIDTGDGAAICFLGDPEEALFTINGLRVALVEHDYPELALRIGINLGPVKVVKDINGRPNIIGDGINVAQRVMSFAEPNQILVSRSYFDIVSCLSEEYAQLFKYVGVHQDKHVREHQVYEVNVSGPKKMVVSSPEPQQPAAIAGPSGPKPQAAPAAGSTTQPGDFDDVMLSGLAKHLVHYLGPIAAVMVRKAASKASSKDDLIRMLADSVPVFDQKKAFLDSVSSTSKAVREQEKPEAAATAPVPTRQAAIKTEVAPAAPLSPETLARAEKLLVTYVGPMAKILVKKAARSAHTPRELTAALAGSIENERDRAAFLAAAEKVV